MSVRDARREARARVVLGVLLRLYPASFREQLGDDLLETVLYRWREVMSARGGALRFWLTEGFRFGLDGAVERVRGAGGSLYDDVRSAVRQLWRAPGFHALAAATLALGMGAATTIFAVTDAVVLRPLRFADAHELYLVHARFGELELSSNSLPSLRELQSSVSAFTWLAAARDRSPALTAGEGEAERVGALDVTERYLEGLGGRVQLGRSFAAADHAAGAERVALISHALWWRRWGGKPDVVGRITRLDGEPHTIAGVMAPEFRDPEPIESGVRTSVWTPVRADDPVAVDRGDYAFRILGRLARGVSAEAARVQLSAVGARLSEAYPDDHRIRGEALDFVLHSLRDQTVGQTGNRLLLLFGAVLMLLILCCVNVANLFLARGNARQAELSVRSALGGTRRRLVRQLLMEALGTATIAGVLGAAVATGGLRLFVAFAPEGIPRLQEAALDTRVFLFVVGVISLTAFGFGIVPAVRGGRQVMASTSGTRTTATRSMLRAQATLVSVEVALSLLLVAGSALLLNSFIRLIRVEPGFSSDDVVVVELRPPHLARTAVEQRLFYMTLLDRSRALPAVSSAALVYSPPGGRGGFWSHVRVEGGDARSASSELFRLNPIAGEFFGVLDIPLLAGRLLSEQDREGDARVTVLNQAAVRRFFPGVAEPVGRRLALGGEPDAPLREVVGIVGDVRQQGLGAEPEPQIYLPYAQEHTPRTTLLLELKPGSPIPATALRALVHELAPDVPIDGISSMSDRMAATAAQARFLAFLLSVFAVIGIVLAAIGTYGTASYAVSCRIRELGIRLALGARAGQLFGVVLFRALLTVGAGVAVGLMALLVLARFLQAYVFGITPRDPATIALACLIISVTATLATVGPALRAARAEPNEVLRAE